MTVTEVVTNVGHSHRHRRYLSIYTGVRITTKLREKGKERMVRKDRRVRTHRHRHRWYLSIYTSVRMTMTTELRGKEKNGRQGWMEGEAE